MGRIFYSVAGRLGRGFFGALLLGTGMLFGMTGCEKDLRPSSNTEGLENLQPVTGSVTFKGAPTPGAIVMFVPQGKSEGPVPRIAGVVEEDGTFEMSTTVAVGTLFGVQPGKYFATVSWNHKVDPNDRDSDDGPDLVPSIYKSHLTSPLRVEIHDGENELDAFELKE
jgi:hypothetical protein